MLIRSFNTDMRVGAICFMHALPCKSCRLIGVLIEFSVGAGEEGLGALGSTAAIGER